MRCTYFGSVTFSTLVSSGLSADQSWFSVAEVFNSLQMYKYKNQNRCASNSITKDSEEKERAEEGLLIKHGTATYNTISFKQKSVVSSCRSRNSSGQ